METGDSFKMLYELADNLGAAVGACRPSLDAGSVPNRKPIGYAGKKFSSVSIICFYDPEFEFDFGIL
jgi:electron transfer flavoprotein alpha subunit